MYRGGVALTLVMLAGCASVDQGLLDQQLPKPPAAWTADASASAQPTDDWVAAFNDPQLYALIDEAMRHNNNLLAAAENMKAAMASAHIARANLLPTLGASANASRNAIVTSPSVAAQSGGGTTTVNKRVYLNNYSLGAQLSWEADLWGRLLDETKASYRDARASLQDYRAARLSIAGAVAQAWYRLIDARLQRELAERDVAGRQSNLRVTDRRYERGVASSLDVRLARSALGTSQANLAFRQRAEKEAERALEVLLGRYPAAEVNAAQSLPELHALSGAGAPADILARRPDLQAAEARMQSAGLRAREARKQLLPQITLSSQIGTSGPNLSDLVDPERLAGNIAAGLLQPLFQGGRLIANSKRARAAAQAALLDYAQTALQAYQEAENAISAEKYLAERESALKTAYEEAAAAEDLTERRYESGAATIFNLLDAQTRRISAESAYIDATQQRLSNRVALYLAIGGDFKTSESDAADKRAESGGDKSSSAVSGE